MILAPENISKTIQNAKSGQQLAFSNLLDTFWNDVYSFQLLRTKNELEAEDITIETFSKAFDKINSYKEEFVFKTWLITISKNLHIDLLRKQKRSLENNTFSYQNSAGESEVLDSTPTAEDQLIQQQNLADLLTEIKKLKPAYQKVINLRYFNEMSYAEMALVLEEPVNNIKVKALRARKLLSELIRNKPSI
ncbi:RNA polymerase, sigma-24 subunit, ECF subfamily [Flavobacteria bacterium MS024-3C]|nr:RNA polymerase, sigma-24 subunit, ECF subfamily [Flavobacteria bacterium MS024-3C]KRO81584.1 MAG: RNA polymerase subunit sigma-70 [Polaribacter sp. BACL8 MAG-120531-bin13]KRP04113.1 MAG: RNA polymerase subunit sigma-70 [Polaribacter sp. BACL8 MAG-120619-bin41]KRP13298.1 MAG: RNA polymerase subunit sigma-70 [Polaribacter sp. BACL8 MAG-120419-bin8]MCO4779131.1 sigma-70 family RNA polymerase sigma factor [Flavobacteriaceae bacterium]